MVASRPSNPADILKTAMQHARAGDHPGARQLLWQTVALDPRNESAWAVLAYVARTAEERRAALWKMLAINPANDNAARVLLRLLDEPHLRAAAAGGVFISYTRADEVFAIELADDLRFVGIPVWLDLTDMPDEMDWHEGVDTALKRCGLMVVVGSPAALRAENVRAEVRRFMDAGKAVMAAICQPCDLNPLGLIGTPVDFTADYAVGLQEIVGLLAAPEPAHIQAYAET